MIFGATASQTCVHIAITDDSLVENDEILIVSLSVPPNIHKGTPSSATVTIIDNDGECYLRRLIEVYDISNPAKGTPIQFTQPDYRIAEDMGQVHVCVELASNLSIPLTVKFTSQDTSPPQAIGQLIPL